MKIALSVAVAAIAYGALTGYLSPMRFVMCVLACLLFARSANRELQKAHAVLHTSEGEQK